MDKALRFRFTQSSIPPANRQILSHQVKSMEHGKPVSLHVNGNRIARGGDRQAGMGGRKKRMPPCNEADKGSESAPTRKGADFRQVLNREKGLEKCNRESTVRRRLKAVDGLPGDAEKWNSVIWKDILRIVCRIQARIVKAVERNLMPDASRCLIKA